MDVIVVGAGPIGNSLVERALSAGHDVVMVEPNPDRAGYCAEHFDARVLAMDVGDEAFVDESRLDKAEAVIATTDDDSTNVMAMLLAHEAGVQTLTSTVNHASHLGIFQRLGVRVLADPERLVAQHLLDITLLPQASDVTTLRGGQQIIELKLNQDSPLINCTQSEVQTLLVDGLSIIARVHDGHTAAMSADDRLVVGDGVIVFAAERVRGSRRGLFRPAHRGE